MSVFDEINQKFGRHTLKLASVGIDQPWGTRSAMCSPSYTTQWSDLPIVKNLT